MHILIIYIYTYAYTTLCYTYPLYYTPNIVHIYALHIYSSIKWAGRPDAAHDKSIPDRLQPRSSFALYVEHAAKTSNNFSNIDIGMYSTNYTEYAMFTTVYKLSFFFSYTFV